MTQPIPIAPVSRTIAALLRSCLDDEWDDPDEIAGFISHQLSPQPDPDDPRRWCITLPSEEDENRRPPALVLGEAHTPPTGVIPDSAWLPEELSGRHRDYLEEILIKDLQCVPRSNSKIPVLRSQILTEQDVRRHRGTLRWVEHGADEVLLYEAGHARFGRQVVNILGSIGCWGDLKLLSRRKSAAARWVLNAVWELWDPSNPWELGIEDETVDEDVLVHVSDINGLLRIFPPEMPFVLSNENGDGEYVFINPFDWRQMGVPMLLYERYYVEHSAMISTWESVPSGYLPFVEKSAEAIGWTLAVGDRSDLTLD
jgi:hypothetical protein